MNEAQKRNYDSLLESAKVAKATKQGELLMQYKSILMRFYGSMAEDFNRQLGTVQYEETAPTTQARNLRVWDGSDGKKKASQPVVAEMTTHLRGKNIKDLNNDEMKVYKNEKENEIMRQVGFKRNLSVSKIVAGEVIKVESQDTTDEAPQGEPSITETFAESLNPDMPIYIEQVPVSEVTEDSQLLHEGVDLDVLENMGFEIIHSDNLATDEKTLPVFMQMIKADFDALTPNDDDQPEPQNIVIDEIIDGNKEVEADNIAVEDIIEGNKADEPEAEVKKAAPKRKRRTRRTKKDDSAS